ncbi:hypothetical protein PS037_23130 (plasmid) [Escherichia albertii]|uniref:hypothetical protein n=1 Tax=Escherichia albertii TaxID=208962 RepID=UPI00235F83A2|nr:hypothetical protein [Escherichia albertii]WDB54736.1 hypothetical protein PS037_23130 [Escherichia albertii]
MMHLKNIRAIIPHNIHSSTLPLFTEDGRSWYEEMDKFKPDTLKIAYDSSGIIRFINKNISTLNPDGLSVIELPDLDKYRNIDTSGYWVFNEFYVIKNKNMPDNVDKKIFLPPSFKFQLTQLVKLGISNECGEIKARTQYINNENQYLVHYLAANGCAMTNWFSESLLIAVKDNENSGQPVLAHIEVIKASK